jgi:hypothetical protein
MIMINSLLMKLPVLEMVFMRCEAARVAIACLMVLGSNELIEKRECATLLAGCKKGSARRIGRWMFPVRGAIFDAVSTLYSACAACPESIGEKADEVADAFERFCTHSVF